MKILLFIVSLVSIFQHFNDPNILGTWNNSEDNTKIEITEQKGVLFS